MAKKVTAKSIAAAAPAGARAPDFLLELEADGWLPVHLPDAGRDPNITKDFIIFDKSETLSSFGIEDGPGNLVEAVTHTASEKVKTEINSIGDLSVVKAMRIPKPSVTITLDTEYYTDENGKRHILSWQFCFIKNGLLYKVLVFPYNDGLLFFKRMLSFLIQYYDLNEPFVKMDGLKFKDYRRWEVPEKQKNGRIKKVVCTTFDEAVSRCCDEEFKAKLISLGEKHKAETVTGHNYREGFFYDYREANKQAIPVTVCCHFSPADLTTFSITDDNGKDILNECSSLQGGIVTLRPVPMRIKNHQGYGRFYPVILTIRDTMCFAPEKKKDLDSLGETIGMHKLVLPEAYTKDRMQDFLTDKPGLFAEYASRDAVITLLYASRLWGVNMQMPVTLSSAACAAALPLLKKHFDLEEDGNEQLDRIYRGLKKVKKGKTMTSDGLRQNISQEYVNADTELIQSYATNSYHGGFNGSSEIGYFYIPTYDFDLQGAYPTAMACVCDIDWKDPIEAEYKNIKVTLDMFDSPADPILGYVKIKFPTGVRYPSIPINVDGCIIFPLSSGEEYVYAAGPDIYTALKLGAEVYAQRLIKARKLIMQDGSTSYSLKKVVAAFIQNRDIAKKIFGKKSLEQLLIKLANNSLYGKVAQNVIQKKSWCARDEQMLEIGPSRMTSTYHAAMITSIVRSVLIAAINQAGAIGCKTYSVTTDGFICEATIDVIESLDLFGFKELYCKARKDLTGSADMWEVKHHQEELLNITTRGNVGFNWITTKDDACFDNETYLTDDEGVLAHNGYRRDKDQTPIEDRIYFAKTVLGRTGKVPCRVPVKTPFKKLSTLNAREDFIIHEETKFLSMDFDMKRKPVKESFYTEHPEIEGEQFEIACFETVPFETVEEYKLYKDKAKNSQVLRTEAAWNAYFERVTRAQNGEKRVAITDYNKRVLQSCVMAVVQGVEIQALCGKAEISILLDRSVSVAKKLNWINVFNEGKTLFSRDDWRNATRKSRLYQLLPEEDFLPLLLKMLAADT